MRCPLAIPSQARGVACRISTHEPGVWSTKQRMASSTGPVSTGGDKSWSEAANSRPCSLSLTCPTRLSTHSGIGAVEQSEYRAHEPLQQLSLRPNAREHADAKEYAEKRFRKVCSRMGP